MSAASKACQQRISVHAPQFTHRGTHTDIETDVGSYSIQTEARTHAHIHTHTLARIQHPFLPLCVSVYIPPLPSSGHAARVMSAASKACQQLVKHVSSTYPFLPLCVSVYGYLHILPPLPSSGHAALPAADMLY
jgi:hypothetical protein